ncbi:MAG: exo-beta-N-acetylmuramidase NamZ domain-containing protein [Planctomycetaceae bacterium]
MDTDSRSVPDVTTGLEQLLRESPALLDRATFGLLMNQASVDRKLNYACDRLAERFPGQLRALFSPQHGLWGEQQANMIETPHGRYSPLDLPVYSLYSETRRPTVEMLSGLDCVVVDLQDVGTRIYTFVWTLLEVLRSCAGAGIKVVVLDRPNPLGGVVIEGPLLEPQFQSFVGGATIPMRPGLTMAELALLLNAELAIGCQLTVVPMIGWKRDMLFAETGLPWVAPSPNMPRLETTLVYPGQVLLEGTTLSEGRGTTLPFELVGAPGLDPFQLCAELEQQPHPGLQLRPVWFRPTFDKHAGQSCGGVAMQVVDPSAIRSFRWTLALLDVVRHIAPPALNWLPPPYEYERTRPPIDILFGSDRLRWRFELPDPLSDDELQALACIDEDAWQKRTAQYHLYH